MTEPAIAHAPDPERSCYQKNRYDTEAAANAVGAEAFEKRGTWIRVYACEECGGFHLTHQRALPPANANWRPPEKSQRQIARERRRDERRGRRRRR